MSESEQPLPFRGGSGMASTGATEEEEVQAARAANWFDVRRIIGGLFLIYGVVMLVTGLAGSHAVKTKAAGINIDLWAGVGMVVFGILMGAWALWRPTAPEPEETRGQGSGRIRRAPAT
ncbi:MAG TPA: hypothetical protein VFP55_05865 [Solirubrobacteraceae bacterium]|nr:hypothetical protein [Solirubrobacteraceae bacterium]